MPRLSSSSSPSLIEARQQIVNFQLARLTQPEFRGKSQIISTNLNKFSCPAYLDEAELIRAPAICRVFRRSQLSQDTIEVIKGEEGTCRYFSS